MKRRAPKQRSRLTRLERELLARAAQFVLAGEWPWDEEAEDIEVAALTRAAEKVEP